MSGMGHAGLTEIDDAGQQTVLSQEIRQAGIPVGEARLCVSARRVLTLGTVPVEWPGLNAPEWAWRAAAAEVKKWRYPIRCSNAPSPGPS